MVSAIGDNYKDQFPQKWPQFPQPFQPREVSREEIAALRKEVEELKRLLKAAKLFDDTTGQPHCEIDDKVKLIREIAKLVCVDLGDVFGPPSKKPRKK